VSSCQIFSWSHLPCLSFLSSLSLATGRAVVGLGVGGEWSIGHAMVAESVPPQFKGRASAFLQTGEPVGVVIAALCEFWMKEGGREGGRDEAL